MDLIAHSWAGSAVILLMLTALKLYPLWMILLLSLVVFDCGCVASARINVCRGDQSYSWTVAYAGRRRDWTLLRPPPVAEERDNYLRLQVWTSSFYGWRRIAWKEAEWREVASDTVTAADIR
ncbi:hypothetical protein KCP74_10060 [Salmonella enterica subsp. enterica]|nr:hypothetical protein KCP74_10060 [Salmonella enterica subsp. enterica]